MKSNAQRVVGILLSMVVGLAIQSRAQERTAFVCEGRIGNAATQPGQALIGDFEYDIGTNTAAPQQIGQFQWESGYPIYFSIVYSAQVHQAFFTLGPTITSQVPAEVFSGANGIGNLNLRVRSVLANSSVWLGNLQLTNNAGVTNLSAMVSSNNNQQLALVTGQPLAAGFKLTGTAVFEWQSPNTPGRSQLAFQISASEPVLFDLDLDSDNNNGRNPPDLSAAEDAIESNAPGKFVFANVNDDDNDGVPDFADVTVAGENNLVPVVLRASPWLDWANTTIRFDYPGPTALDLPGYTGHNLGSGFTNYTGAATNNLPANTIAALRLWNITGPDATKAAASYVVPGRTYTANELGFTGSSTYYLEGVLPGFTNLVASLTQGAIVLSDTVAVTVVYANLGVNNSNNSHDEDPTTRDSLRPGTPDVAFDIDEHDEMLEDQGDGFRFWWSRDSGATVTMNGIVDLVPLVVDISQDLVAAGFRFYLRADGASLDAYPAVSPATNHRLYLQDLVTAESQLQQSAVRVPDGTDVELSVTTGGRHEYVFKANGSGTTRFRVSLVIREPTPSQNRVEADAVRCTYANSRDLWLLASARGNNSATEPYEYRTEDNRAVPSNQFHRYPAPHEYAQGLTGGRDSDRTQYVVWVHGYNNSEAAAIATFDEMHRRLFWLGFRGNFIGFTWHSDEWSGVLPPVVLFDTQVQNAFQTAPSLMLFLRDHVGTAWGSPPENINVVAHSLGNFVAYDALRLHRRTAAAPLINNLVGLESATWPECYLTEQQIAANGGIRYTSDPITYTATDLKQHSWAFWFGQQNFEVPGTLRGEIYHSHIPNDRMLYWMRRNDGVQRGMPTLLKGWHYRRNEIDGLPAGFRSPIEEPGRPNLYNDIPTLMIQPSRHVPYSWGSLHLPVGTATNAMATFNYAAREHGTWPSGQHSAYLLSFPQMYGWYRTLFAGEGPAPRFRYPPSIPIGEE